MERRAHYIEDVFFVIVCNNEELSKHLGLNTLGIVGYSSEIYLLISLVHFVHF